MKINMLNPARARTAGAHGRFRPRSLHAALAMAMLLAALPMFAADINLYWTNAAPGSWWAPANWTPNIVPLNQTPDTHLARITNNGAVVTIDYDVVGTGEGCPTYLQGAHATNTLYIGANYKARWLQLGNTNTTARVYHTSGLAQFARNSAGAALIMGGNPTDDVAYEISGGSLDIPYADMNLGTATGAKARFTVVGTNASSIRIRGSGSTTGRGEVYVYSNAVYEVQIASGGVTPMSVEASGTGGAVTFHNGSKLKAGFKSGTTPYSGTWTVMTIAGAVTDNGLALDAGNGWSTALDTGSSPKTLKVSYNGSTTLLTSSANPAVAGSDIVFTAAVQTNGVAAGDATGTVVFKDGGTPLSTNAITGGVVTYTNNALGIATHTITAEYSGDVTYGPSVGTLEQVVDIYKPPTTTELTSSSNPSLVGAEVVLSATVKNNGVTPGDLTGTVTFREGLTVLGTSTLMGGVATYTNNSFQVGAHLITAQYSGDANYAVSFSEPATQVVQTATTLTLGSSANPVTVSNAVIYTATLSSNGVATAVGATGTVVFKDGGTALWTTNMSAGVASFTTSGLELGAHTITAEYSGDGYYLASTSPAVAQVVNPVILIPTFLGLGADCGISADNNTNWPNMGTNTSAMARSSGSNRSQKIFLRFDLSQIAPGSISSASLVFVSGATRDSSVGPRAWGLINGDPAELWDETGIIWTNAPGLTGADASEGIGVEYVDTSRMVSLGKGNRINATFLNSYTLLSGTSLVDFLNSKTNGVATLMFDGNSANQVNWVAMQTKEYGYASAPYLLLGANTLAQPATATLATSGSPSRFSNSVTFTATVQTNGVTALDAGGTVSFESGGKTIGVAVVDHGVAQFATSTLPIGTNLVTALYSGDGNYLGGVASGIEQVVQADTTTVIALGSANPLPNDGMGGEPFFTAEVRTNGVTAYDAEGTMVFKEGATVLASVPVVGGTAFYSTPALLTPGWHYVTAEYSGAGIYLASTSSIPAAQAVYDVATQAVSTMIVGSSINPSVVGQGVMLTATIYTNSGMELATVATGTVVFKDGAVTLGSGGVTNGVASLTTSAMAYGVRTIAAEYSGDATHGPTPGSLSQTVQTPTTTVLTSSANPSTNGVNVIFTATVEVGGSPAAQAWGWVDLYDGATLLGNLTLVNGLARYTNNSLALGTHSMRAEYSGDFNVYLGSTNSPDLSQVVKAATTTMLVSSLNPSTNGNEVTLTIEVRTNGVAASDATGTVIFKNGGTPFATNTVAAGVAASVTSALPVGTNSLTAEFSGDATYFGSLSATLWQVVMSTLPTTGTNLTWSVSGGQLTLGWPAEYAGWILQEQTNALSVGLSTDWVDVGVISGTSTNVPLNTAPAAFYRLRSP